MTQSAADVTLDVVPNAIYLPQTGGEKTIDITTNSSVYDVTTSEEVSWLKIVKSEEEIKLIAERNDTYQKREVKLYAKSGSVICEMLFLSRVFNATSSLFIQVYHRTSIRLWTLS